MEKWADYGISVARYDDERKHITRVKVHEDTGDSMGASEEWTRTKVVSPMEQAKTFVTILKGNEGEWKKGQDIHIITVNNVKYIRTDQNRTASDNLENLPEF